MKPSEILFDGRYLPATDEALEQEVVVVSGAFGQKVAELRGEGAGPRVVDDRTPEEKAALLEFMKTL